ncbi:hypothetical protein D9M72_602610 [compost metagenome]
MTLLTGTLGFTTTRFGTIATRVIGAKSLTGSYGSLEYSDWLIACVPMVPMNSV